MIKITGSIVVFAAEYPYFQQALKGCPGITVIGYHEDKDTGNHHITIEMEDFQGLFLLGVELRDLVYKTEKS